MFRLNMRLSVKFSIYRQGVSKLFPYANELNENEFDILRKKYPNACLSNRFEYQGDPESDLTKSIIGDLSNLGREANWTRFDGLTYQEKKASLTFQIHGERLFDKDEINNAEYLWCLPGKEIAKTGYRHDDGIIEVDKKSITTRAVGSTVSGFHMVCKETVKQLMIAESFTNLLFKPVRVAGKTPPKELLWEVWSEKTLPPVLNPLANERGEKPDVGKGGCWVNDLYFPPVLKYNKLEVENELGEFDIAITNERWHWGVWQRRSPYIIVSRRFREWCIINKFKMTWVPVEMV